MLYHVTHHTTYRYAEAVAICHNAVHLAPRSTVNQRCHDFLLNVQPAPSVLEVRQDFFGNQVTLFSVQELHEQLEVVSCSRVEVQKAAPPDAGASPPWEQVADLLIPRRAAGHGHALAEPIVYEPLPPNRLEAMQFAADSPLVASGPDLAEYARPSFAPGRPLLEAVFDLTARIHREFTYDPTFTSISTPLADVLTHRRGVCQDFAHLQIGCLRSLGLAARYVSGYIATRPPPGQQRLVGADASHAWPSVFCPGVGWVDVDPTNNLLVSDEHVTLAWGRDYSDVSPVRGVVLGGGQHQLTVSVDMAPAEP